eukprot:CAMPEP_0197027010 /NCGR_PEP_ID=MMETSP1384-20130603/7010_1 /TAXON_ID=29189 /ORGANISM="Ammonia sp." /LENGTH=308 /DNA_ID=CAMNT_0042455799 /DNA_START=89 /DNA_END=1015 /DNA_ORIENTATION=+
MAWMPPTFAALSVAATSLCLLLAFAFTAFKYIRQQIEANKKHLNQLQRTIENQAATIRSLQQQEREQSNLLLTLQENLKTLNTHKAKRSPTVDQPWQRPMQQNSESISRLNEKLTQFETESISTLQAMQQELKAKEKSLCEFAEKLKQMNKEMVALQQTNDAEDEKEKEKEQKQKQETIGIAAYKSTKESNPMSWNVVAVQPTLQGMIRSLENNDEDIVIGMAGLYRVLFRYCSLETSVADWNRENRAGSILVNGSTVAYQLHCDGNAYGEMTEVIRLKTGDAVQCRMTHKTGSAEYQCALIVERVCE